MADQKQQAAAPKPGAPANGTKPAAAAKEAAPVKSRSERFKEIAPKRTRDILKKLEILGNCSNASGYEYTSENIDKIFGTIQKKLDETKAKFSPKTAKAAESAFTL